MYKILFAAALLFLSASAAFAMDGCGAGPCANCHSLTVKEASELLRDVGEVKKVQPAPVNGLWLIDLERGGRKGVVFMDYGKKNIIAGTVFPLGVKNEAGKPAAGDGKGARIDVSRISPDNSIVIGNPGGKKRLFVFTDPECPFCARQHEELKSLVAVDPDLAVYIKMFPLPMHPGAYDKARIVLGGGSAQLLEKAFSGAALAPQGPDYAKKAVDETIKLGKALGIDSTPTLVLPDGRVLPGYRDTAAVAALLAPK